MNEGTVCIRGRADARAVRGGRNIDLTAVEKLAKSHPDVRRAAVLAMPSRVAGEDDVVLIAQCDSGVGTRQLRDWVRTNAEDAALVPQRVVLMDDLPLTHDGEIALSQLKALLIRKLADERR
jgi:non-ribosomal peptide synthetase component E (peptide arylation enzyme)